MGTLKTKLPQRALWALSSVLVTNVGNGIQNLVVAKLLFDATHSTVDFGLTLVSESLLAVTMQLFAGPLVDRRQPKLVMVLVDLVRGVIVLACGIGLVEWRAVFLWVMVAVVAINVGSPFYRTASFAIGPNLAPGELLIQYNARSAAMVQIGQILGVLLAGPIMFGAGAAAGVMVNGVTYLFAAGAIWVARMPRNHLVDDVNRDRSAASNTMAIQWRKAIRVVRETPGLLWHIMIVSGDFLAVAFFNIALVPLVFSYFGGSPLWLSYLDGSFAVGSVISAMFTLRWTRALGKRRSALVALLAQSVLLITLGHLRRQAPLTVAAMMLLGGANTWSVTVLMTALQRRIPDAVRGRVGALRAGAVAILSLVAIPLVTEAQSRSLAVGLGVSGVIVGVFFAGVLLLGSSRGFGVQLLESTSASEQVLAGSSH